MIKKKISTFICILINFGWLWNAGPASAQVETADVLIVGAGLSGLSAAFHLKKSGKSAVILEMSPHIGGRIRTANYENHHYAEVGLEEFWENNPVIAIFDELKIPLETSYTSFSSFYYQNKLYPFTHDSNMSFLAAFLDADELKSYQAWDKKMIELNAKLSQHPLPSELLELQNISFAEWIQTTSGLSLKTQEFVRIQTEPEYATSWKKISALDGIAEWHLFSGIGLKPRHVVGGNQRAAESIADFIGRNNIRLNQLVTHIRSNGTGVEVTTSQQDNFQQHTFRARYVIVAIPLFRLNDIQFTPALNPEIQQAIQTQSSGAYFTAHVLVDGQADSFWKSGDESILPILTDGALGVIYEGHTTEKTHDALLNLLITGPHAERLNARAASGDEIRESILNAFDERWPGFRLSVKQIFFYRYHPRAIASWPIGRSRFDHLSNQLRMPQDRVYFAGDFTEDTHSNGAVNSAIRAVESINKITH